MSDKNNGEGRKKTNAVTAIWAAVLVILAILLLVFMFQRVKDSDKNYAPISEPGQDISTEETDSAGWYSYADTQSAKPAKEDLEKEEPAESVNGTVDREFCVDGHTFCLMEKSLEPGEEDISAEEAAQAGYEALREYFPEENWESPFHVKLELSRNSPLIYDVTDSRLTVWLIWYKNPDSACTAVNPRTGEVIFVYCPKGEPYLTRDDFVSPVLSLHDFYYLSDDSTWRTNGLKLIRQYGLNGDAALVQFDEKAGIRHENSGSVYADYSFGSGDDERKVRIVMDLLTQEFIGAVFYEKL